MSISADIEPRAASISRVIRSGALALALTFYVAVGSAASIIYPPIGLIFLAPVIYGIIRVAPEMRAVPRNIVLPLLIVGAFLLPVWPPYLFVKLGPLPALVPPRIVIYALSAIWAYDMTFSPLRRGQFVYAIKRSGAVTALFFFLFALGFASLPLAEGRSIAAPEFLRQCVIWLVPFCAYLTYCRRQRDFVRVMKAVALGAVFVAAIAIAEYFSGTLLANVLSPVIADDAEWLRNAQSLKIRDGAFRAQATHTHPLSLGEYLALCAPFALAFSLSAKKPVSAVFWLIGFAMMSAAALATNSRGALLVTGVNFAVMGGVLAWRFLRRTSATRWRPLAGLAFLLVIAAAPVAAIGAHAVISGKGGESAANSTQARLDQIEMAWPKILKRPIGGYGTGRSARVLGYWGRTLTLDNYYLSLALDLGLPGPLTFLALLAAWGWSAFRRSVHAHPHLGVVYLACFSAVLSVAISRSIISLTGNLSILYMIMGAFAGVSVTFSNRRSRNRVWRRH